MHPIHFSARKKERLKEKKTRISIVKCVCMWISVRKFWFLCIHKTRDCWPSITKRLVFVELQRKLKLMKISSPFWIPISFYLSNGNEWGARIMSKLTKVIIDDVMKWTLLAFMVRSLCLIWKKKKKWNHANAYVIRWVNSFELKQ